MPLLTVPSNSVPQGAITLGERLCYPELIPLKGKMDTKWEICEICIKRAPRMTHSQQSHILLL